MMEILVTGGAGYIGSHTVKALIKRGYNPVILDNLVYGHQDFVGTTPFEYGDLQDQSFIEEVFNRHKISAVMHFAAYAYVGESVENPLKYYRNNYASTLNLLEVMLKFGVKNFIFSSTCATYGEPSEVPISESHPQNPLNPYGRSKFFVEQTLKEFDQAYGLKYVALRYFNASGADESGLIGEDHTPETHLIPLVLDVALGKRKHITVFGKDYPTKDGTCIRDYIHVNDLADAHIRALDFINHENRSAAFNLGNGNGFSVLEVIEAIQKVTGKNITVEFGPRRPGDPAKLIGSFEKARKELGWEPRYKEIESIVSTAWKWHQARFSS